MTKWTLEELGQTVITFGEFRGQTFDEVDILYLDRLIGWTGLYGVFKAKLEAYMAHPTIRKIIDEEIR